jgi:hypothetical protein
VLVAGISLLFLVTRGRWSRPRVEAAVLMFVGAVLAAYGPLEAVATASAERRTVLVDVEDSPAPIGRFPLRWSARFRGEGVDGVELQIPWEARNRLRKGERVRITYTPATREIWEIQVVRQVAVPGGRIGLDVAGERYPAPAFSSPFFFGSLIGGLGLMLLIGGLVRLARAAGPLAGSGTSPPAGR